MKNLASLFFEVWTDGAREVVAIQGEQKPDATGRARRISFYMSSAEFASLVEGKTDTASDITHKLYVCGDSWTFYDLDFPSQPSGEMRVPYYRATMPNTFMRAILRLCRKTWKYQHEASTCGPCLALRAMGALPVRECRMCPEGYRIPRVRIELSASHRTHIERLYGQGKGLVDWALDERSQARLEEVKVDEIKSRMPEDCATHRDHRTFAENLERLETIARNGTRGFHQRGKVRLSRDADSFYFVIVRPDGRSSMNGGLINHGAREGKHDWSLHT